MSTEPGSARSSLHPCGDVRRVAEHFAAGFYDDRPGLMPTRADSSGAPLAAFLALRSESARWIASAARTARWRRFLRLRVAEQRHQPVAELFQHVAAEPGYRRRSLVEIGVDEVAPVLGVEFAARLVEPTRSQNMTVIGRRSAA